MLYLEQWLIVALYAIAQSHYIYTFRQAKAQAAGGLNPLAAAAVTAHLFYLIHLSFTLGHMPVTSIYEALTTCAWLFGVVYLSLEWRLHERSLGMFILPIILILHLLSNIGIDFNRELPALLLHEIVFEIHVIVLLFAYSAFAISFIASVLYLLLSRELQKKSTGLFYRRLPSLAFFDSLSNRAVNIGLIFLTLGVALGIYEGTKIAEQFFIWDAKFIAAGLTWLIYFWHWAGRLSSGWQGKRTAVVSLLGFGWLMFSFLIVSLAFTEVHDFR
ncbi:hypothetical protein DWB58_13960 [candidate division KSB1 bacterium]|nr:hypothetical protein [candidate division KSB1 bacterium]